MRRSFAKSIFVLTLFGQLNALEFTINSATGEDFSVEIDTTRPFDEVIDILKNFEGTHIAWLSFFQNKVVAKTKINPLEARDYYKPLTKADQENISYLMTTLAYQSLVKLASKKSSLSKIGDQLEYLHPLLFLKHVFSNDELIVSIHNIKGRSWVWSEFIDPILDSLDKEMKLGNLTQDQILDMSVAIHLDPLFISEPIQSRNWSGLINNLLSFVQRSGDAKRYDM